MKLSLLLFLCIIYKAGLCQNISEVISEPYENIIKTDQSEVEDEIPPEYQRLIDHPIDINSNDIEVLVELNLISSLQCTALKEHILKFGNLIALQELQVINEFDLQTIKLILPYIIVTGSTAAEDEFHNLTLRFQQQVKNYIPADFQGDPTKITIKYRGNINGNISCALLAEKDPGEKVIFGAGKAGFDFYSFFTQIRLKGIIKKMIIGDFSVSFGQGITAWSGSGYSSNENIISTCKSGRGIYPSTSTDENRYLRGIAVQGELRKIQYFLWASSHKIDGNIETDSITGQNYIRSFLTSGYHRTQSESNGYHTCRETYVGTSVNTTWKGWKTGITSTFYTLDLPLHKTIQDYNLFDFRGRSNFNIGIDYIKTIKNILLYGEAGTCSNKSYAIVNGLLISINKNLAMSSVYHNYQKEFHSLKSNPYGSNTNTANEKGIYLGINLKLNRTTSLTTYVNRDEFPFLKFRNDLPSISLTKGFLFTYSPNKKITYTIRYRNKISQLNNSNDYNGIRQINDLNIRNARFTVAVISSDTWEFRSKAEIGIKKINNIKISDGYFICQDIFFHPPQKKISGNMRYALYYSPDFDLRFYEYENDLPGTFAIPFYYGNGSKFYVNLGYKIRNLIINAKYSRSWITYGDDKISNTSAIDDIKLQLKINL